MSERPNPRTDVEFDAWELEIARPTTLAEALSRLAFLLQDDPRAWWDASFAADVGAREQSTWTWRQRRMVTIVLRRRWGLLEAAGVDLAGLVTPWRKHKGHSAPTVHLLDDFRAEGAALCGKHICTCRACLGVTGPACRRCRWLAFREPGPAEVLCPDCGPDCGEPDCDDRAS